MLASDPVERLIGKCSPISRRAITPGDSSLQSPFSVVVCSRWFRFRGQGGGAVAGEAQVGVHPHQRVSAGVGLRAPRPSRPSRSSRPPSPTTSTAGSWLTVDPWASCATVCDLTAPAVSSPAPSAARPAAGRCVSAADSPSPTRWAACPTPASRASRATTPSGTRVYRRAARACVIPRFTGLIAGIKRFVFASGTRIHFRVSSLNTVLGLVPYVVWGSSTFHVSGNAFVRRQKCPGQHERRQGAGRRRRRRGCATRRRRRQGEPVAGECWPGSAPGLPGAVGMLVPSGAAVDGRRR